MELLLRFYLVLMALCASPFGILAQRYTVSLHAVDKTQAGDAVLAELTRGAGDYATGDAAYGAVTAIVPELQQRGYLSASIDSIAIADRAYDAYVFVGRHYKWAKVGFDSIPEGVMTLTGIRKEQWEGRALDARQVARVSERLLRWAENNGYPFASVRLEGVSLKGDGGVHGNFILDKGVEQKIDSVAIHGDVKVSRNYLLNYLEIKHGDAYNEEKLRSISPRLRELPFLQEATPWDVSFKLSRTTLSLYLKEKKANQLNALIGLLPNSVETGKFLLTVDAQFAFQNILGQGESISLSYQNLQYKSPRLRADLVYPYLLNTRFGVDVHFDLFKKDTSFRRTMLQAGVRYQLSATDYLRVFYQNQSNRLITIDTLFVRNNKRLPDDVDVSANGAGVELGLNRTDYRINPRKGWEVRISGSTLLRRVRKSDAVTGLTDATGFNYAGLYDTLIRRQYQYFVSGSLTHYLPLGKKAVLKSAYNGGWVGGGQLFRNELYQIGGFRLLRGFDEQSIFTNHYHVATLELRLLLDQNSFFYLFSDNGYVVSDFNGFFKDDIYNGFGLGTTLETKSGLFSISYGLGRNSTNPVQFRQSKIHFGYLAFF